VRPQRRWRLWEPEWQQSAGLWQEAERLRQEAEPPVVVAELVELRRLAARRRHLPGLLEVVLMAE
jgi:hypothetical protein